MEDTKRILPIFYDVDPSHVRHQRGSFAEALTKHEKRFSGDVERVNWWRAALRKAANLFGWDSKHEEFSGDVEKVNRWRAALRKVANLSGLDSKNYKCERELIKVIVKRVWAKVNPTTFRRLDSQEKLVRIDFSLEQLRLQLDLEANDVRFVGILGMGGVGKTTLANLVFERISHNFELSSFLSNVREVSAKHGSLVDLQRQLLSPILKENIIQVTDERSGIFFTKKCLCNKKVLIILDDVDQLKQLETLVGEKNWFGLGSRIVITTRNERLLVEHGITIPYEVKALHDDEALELFSQNAFRKSQPEEGFLELSKCFLHYAKGLPLALKTLGSSLYMRDQDTWNSVLYNLKKIPDPEIFDSLKVSYYGLKEMEKKFFLHVACFHKGKHREQVIEILDSNYDISSRIVIAILIEKSLITIVKKRSPRNTVQMHDLIQEMAWQIVRQESLQEPGQRSLLWLRDDISFVFMNNTGTGAIEAIVLHFPVSEVVHWNCTEALSEMYGLRLLEFDNVIISLAPRVLPNSLRIIRWSWYPSKSLPSSFEPCFLVELKMHHSKLFRLWDGAKDLPKLKCMDLSYSDQLTSTPDFTGIPNLEILLLQHCTNLVEVHSSFAVLKRLKVLDLSYCNGINSLPSEVEMDSLINFNLSDCSKVKKIPEFVGQMNNLSHLYLRGTAIEEIPSSIERLVGLTTLDISNCKSLLGLPSAICNLKCLAELHLEGCSEIDKMPGEMESLGLLYLKRTAMREPLVVMKNLVCLSFHGSVAKSSTSKDGLFRKSHPDPDPWGLVLSSLNRLCSLSTLDLSDCNIGEGAIPDDIGCLSSLRELNLSGNNFVSLPSSIRFLSKLELLELVGCERLEQLPDLPPKKFSLFVNVDNCISLKRLSDPSRLSGGANVYDFDFSCLNCFKLVEDEGWIHRIFFMIMKASTKIFSTYTSIICPGSEIPEWFSNRSGGDSITVELPPQSSCNSNRLGIAVCVVFEDSEYLDNPAALLGYDHFDIRSSLDTQHFKFGYLKSQHLWVFYYHPRLRDASSSHRFSFESDYYSTGSSNRLKTSSNIKECGARVVHARDLEEFSRILKIPKPAALHAYHDEAGPVGTSGSGSSHDVDVPNGKRFKKIKYFVQTEVVESFNDT
ncbi:TMV resistance protein N-like isoform X2 [Prunus avium]|uniref:ADP-ribosyl cyclase/cyclic ADP-ribose hydrolase n=1 Tax=Prunus avium TaxID=42229 RepID=A0A6P5RJB3_PRUAV|nr:TMV resistance protein N-like isoform X2 [Prunus avium]